MKMKMMKDMKTIVCDIGAGSIKIGFAGKLRPQQVIPTVIAVPQQRDSQGILIGKEALNVRYRKDFVYIRPIDEYGIVQDWAALETIVLFALRAIGIHRGHCHNHKILLTKSQTMKRSDIQYLLDLLFNKFHFAAVTMHEQSALVLYTQGVETGIVVELGDTMATIVPVYKGYAIPNLNKRMAVGGRSISQFLAKLLRLRGYHIDPCLDLEAAREIKERGSYVALDPAAEEKLAEETTILEKTFHLHDGGTISIGKERFEAAEALFQPGLWDSGETKGLAGLIFETIQEAAIDCRVDLYQNIVLSGGSSLLPGLPERLQAHLIRQYEKEVLQGSTTQTSRPRSWKVEVHAPETRQFAVFEGAALFADLISNDIQFWTTRADCKERVGIELLLDKCQVI
jgi:actin-related protein 2